jgi:hypothetical protein
MASVNGPDIFSTHRTTVAVAKAAEAAIELEAELEAFDAGQGSTDGIREAHIAFAREATALTDEIFGARKRLGELVTRAKEKEQTTASPTRLADRRR